MNGFINLKIYNLFLPHTGNNDSERTHHNICGRTNPLLPPINPFTIRRAFSSAEFLVVCMSLCCHAFVSFLLRSSFSLLLMVSNKRKWSTLRDMFFWCIQTSGIEFLPCPVSVVAAIIVMARAQSAYSLGVRCCPFITHFRQPSHSLEWLARLFVPG